MLTPLRFANTVVLAGLVFGLTGCQISPVVNATGQVTENVSTAFRGEKRSDLHDPSKLYLAYAKWQEHSGNLVAAKQSYEVVLEENPKTVEAVLGLARVAEMSQKTAEAEQGYQQALAMAPDNPLVLDAVGQHLVARGQYAEGTTMLEQAVKGAPLESKYSYHLGIALAQQQRYNEAMPYFARSVGQAEAHYNVGYIGYQKGDIAQAKQHFAQAVQLKPSLVQARTMLAALSPAGEGGLQLASHRGTGVPTRTASHRQTTPTTAPVQTPNGWQR